MKSRCKNSNYKNYHRYGGRGIKVCDEWDKNFKEFYNWSLNNGYSDNLTIDRIDVNGNYEPSNCRWATKITQANNRDNNRIIEFEGEAHTLTEWSRIKGLGFKTLDYRLKAGWQLEKVFNKPLDIKCSHKKEDLKEDK
ncbi:hypothetical protein [Clostridium butyricum]|nr:hypothetical protein [Clostridium butyricum]